jgi:adenosylcobyric acid synthase
MSAAAVLMVQGTASSVGKSALVAGLCRMYARRGVRVAPFKAQNMSNNAAVCPTGGEIGRAQYAQALAAGIQPTVDMNPILLKPQGGASQVIVHGKLHSTRAASDYFSRATHDLWPAVTASLDRLRDEYELVIIEGAGSPAEINLRDRELVNMRVARHAQASVFLVADIDKGGAFAALLGTWQWLEPAERALVRGFILNKFRGDASLLAPAPALLEARTGIPVVGVVPFLDDLGLAEEDAASLTSATGSSDSLVEIAVVRLPHIANFDEFGALAAEPGVRLRYVTRPAELRAPDLVILPGTKATLPDLDWLTGHGLAERLVWLASHSTSVLGICGGLQMLGREVRDPLHIESMRTRGIGLGLLPIETSLDADKHLERVAGTFASDLTGIWQALAGVTVEGYEIHTGRTSTLPGHGHSARLLELGNRRDGFLSADGSVASSYVHGLFEGGSARTALIQALAARRGFRWQPGTERADAFDRLADAVSRLDLKTISD